MDQEELSCWICLDLLKDPVTLPCGHNYCMNCIKDCWDGRDQRKPYSCPQCRQTFRSRPELKKNFVLADLVEKLKKIRSSPDGLCYAGPGDVSCDSCTGRKLKAVKSCLQCLVSFCEQHLQPHYQSEALEKHQLVDASKKLQENIFSRHDEVVKIFCRSDQRCICCLCSFDEHKDQDSVSAAAERNNKQRVVGLNQEKIQQRIQDREEDVRVEAISQTFKDLIHLDVKQQIRSKQTDEVRRRSSELEDLVQVLTSDLSESTNPPNISKVHRLQFYCDVTVAVSKIKDKLRDSRPSPRPEDVPGLKTLTPAEPKTRAEFLRYSRRLTLDPTTAHRKVLLSDRSRTATFSCRPSRSGVDHPDRFKGWFQVLSRESLTGRCYWEVEQKLASVAVSYKDVSRTGPGSEFGADSRSWALEDSFYFIHDGFRTPVSGSWFSRIGVYVDHSAGILSFYRVSKTMTLIHRVQTTFTQPLYAGFRLYGFYCYVRLCELK